ncbi:dihydrofolate reductase family protein [Membranihabitans marinus]|uniref:dihydrofolate reductase family protein n=1 Tax=Membranihabitans marinus TaxID=1227546 RepID=UPI001F25D3AA|nr:dihydrofolate reductase family protein [Membranihabitans marinus]
MGKVFIHLTMSLDGFIAKPNEDDWDWIFKHEADDSDDMENRVMQDLGAVVLGNKDFKNNKVTADALPYGGLQIPQFVVTHNARKSLTVGPLTFNFVTGGVGKVIQTAKEAAGAKNVAILGHSIAQQGLELGLVDELVVHVYPVIFGNGLRLIDQLGCKPIDLERIEIISTTQITSMRFRVLG